MHVEGDKTRRGENQQPEPLQKPLAGALTEAINNYKREAAWRRQQALRGRTPHSEQDKGATP